jgi:P4 family phage/plasmid primase-like protien
MNADLRNQIAYTLATEIVNEINPVTILESGEIRTYESGCLIPYGKAKIARIIEERKFDLNTPDFFSKVIHHVKSNTSVSLEELSKPSQYINLKNGLLDVDSLELLKHSRERATLTQFPIKYNPNAGCRNFLKALHEIQPDPQSQLRILKSWALCFDRRCMKRQIDLWIGRNDTGKSTLARVLLHLLGKQNVSMESTQALSGEDPYAKAELFQKAANISFDLSEVRLREAGELKELVGGDGIRARFIYEKPFNFLPYQKIFALCNRPPSTDDKLFDDLAFWERWRITFFPRQFLPEEQDESLVDEVEPERSKLINKTELSGIFNLLVPILRRIRKTRDYGYNFNGVETREIWLAQVDYIQKWMNEAVVVGADYSVPVAVFREAWNAWRIANRVSDPGVTEFNAHVSKRATSTTGKVKIGGVWKSVKVWKGLTLKSLTVDGNSTLM